MKILKRLLFPILILSITIFQIPCYSFASSSINISTPTKVGVLFYSFNDLFLSKVKQDLENIQKENPDKVEFTFFDGKANPSVQYQIIDNLIQGNFDLLVLNMVERRKTDFNDIISKAKSRNIPLVLYISSAVDTDILKTYPKAIILTPELKGPGVTEGKILVDVWNTDKKSIDKNGDNVLQYIMLQGRPDSEQTIERTKYSIQTINEAGIQTQELASNVANWDKELAKSIVSSLFLKYATKIEAIISNNDAMAIGAIEALQQYGYNKGDNSKFIHVVGIDALPEAKDLVDKGLMTGTVTQDPHAIADAIYKVGMNLVAGETPIKDTNYILDNSVVTIPLQYEIYKKTST